jgi:hypothetical protein
MRADYGLVSRACFQIWTHYVLNATDSRIFNYLSDIRLSPFVIITKRLKHDVHANTITELEAVNDGFLCAIYPDRNVVDTAYLDTRLE